MTHFDFHFHLLFKHHISNGIPVTENVDVKGLADLLNKLFGGPFESQASPKQVTSSNLCFGVLGTIALEYAFVNRMFRVPGFKLQNALPLNQDMLNSVKTGTTTYHKLFKAQLEFTNYHINKNKTTWSIQLLNRSKDMSAAKEDINNALKTPQNYRSSRWFVLSIEGGHNLSEAYIKGKEIHHTPELTLAALQDSEFDFISLNLCHLSYIPEMHLGGFAQGLNKQAQIAFSSEDFHPSVGLGITPLGKKVIKQALTHHAKPILIDVKHMSLYSRLEYYRYKEKLAIERPAVSRLPIISSHTGFTFYSIAEYIGKQQYKVRKPEPGAIGKPSTAIMPNERRIGRTDDWINSGMHGNPWSINLFDEEIVEIMKSNGLIGISLDQRVLGTARMVIDSGRGEVYEEEHIALDEYNRLFRDRQFPAAERIELVEGIFPMPRERHSMLLALHLIHAVRVGYATGIEGNSGDENSPWDYVCIGSDFDGLINPINAVKNVTDLPQLEKELRKYLPQADKALPFNESLKALRYDHHGNIDQSYMNKIIEKVLVGNGLRFLKRFLNNWS